MTQFHPLASKWFPRRFRAATDSQAGAWREIAAGRDALISAATRSGKTLAFLVRVNRLIREGLPGTLDDRIHAVNVSPLKSLSNDVEKNLEQALAPIAALAVETGLAPPPIRVALRMGHTPAHERQQLVRRRPHILVMTSESLFILLTADRSLTALQTTRTVIVDEIHARVDDKRGGHLASSLARLDDLIDKARRGTRRCLL